MKLFTFALAGVFFVVLAGTAFAEFRPSAAEIDRMLALLPEIGELQQTGLFPVRTIRVGEPFKAGEVAYFFHYLDGSPAWILEEWSELSAGKFRVVYWRFFFDADMRAYSKVSVTETLIEGNAKDGWIGRDVSYDELVDITTSKMTSDKSERVWRLLKRAGKPA